MRRLLVDLGHSRLFPGAKGFRDEVSFVREIWQACEGRINPAKWQIIRVPECWALTANQQLIRRINWINAHSTPADWLLSIHSNAASNPRARGITTCFMAGSHYARAEAQKLSKAMSVATKVPVWMGGDFPDTNGRFGRIGMVRDTKPMALLVEAGFVTSEKDMSVAPGLYASGIANYLNSF